jgi:hypothetical protein
VRLLLLYEIYAKAKNEWLTVDKTQNQIVFTTDAQGFIQQCGYTPNNCTTNECFVGVNIKEVTKL